MHTYIREYGYFVHFFYFALTLGLEKTICYAATGPTETANSAATTTTAATSASTAAAAASNTTPWWSRSRPEATYHLSLTAKIPPDRRGRGLVQSIAVSGVFGIA